MEYDTMAQNNGFPKHIIHSMKKKLISKQVRQKLSTTEPQTTQQNKKWVTFTYYSPLIREVTNLFKRTNLNIAFRTTNTIYQQLSDKSSNINPSGMYQLKCNTCNNAYIRQTGRPVTVRHKEHIHYIKTNNPTSAYAMHILNNRQKYGSAEETLRLLKACSKGTNMNCWETLYVYLVYAGITPT
jgi:hypothetical protein